jgi:hypothetical protein
MGEAKKKKEALAETPKDKVNNILAAAKDKFELAIVIGVNDNGLLDISTNVPQFHVMQWLLNKASFEMFVIERNSATVPAEVSAAAEGIEVVDG